MEKIVVLVFGPDRPGIIAAVSKVLFEQGCNLEDVSQTILQTEFVGIFVASMSDVRNKDRITSELQAQVAPLDLFVHVGLMKADIEMRQPLSEPFVITTFGRDRPGLVAGITSVLAQYEVNITNLKAAVKSGPQQYVMFYEVDIPVATDQRALRNALYERAAELGLEISLQHREIFEQIHRV